MRPRITVALCLFACVAHADDLDVIVSDSATTEQRSEAYSRLVKADFSSIAPKLLSLIPTQLTLTGSGPSTKEPWKEERLTPRDRVRYTLWQIWDVHTDMPAERGKNFPLYLDLLEHAPAGDARGRVISILKSRLENGLAFRDKSLPPMKEWLPRFDRLVRDKNYPTALRLQLIELLFIYGDPNEYLDLAIALTSEGSAIRQSEDFRFATPTQQSVRFSDANRKKYVIHCYQLLERIDDGHSGTGYFLAMHIGGFIGVEPIVRGESPFKPDQRLPEYQESGGLKKSYFQDTVNNAMKWWAEHKAWWVQHKARYPMP